MSKYWSLVGSVGRSVGRELVVVEVLEQRIAIPPAIAAAREQEVCADSGG